MITKREATERFFLLQDNVNMFSEYTPLMSYVPTAILFTCLLIVSVYTDIKYRLIYNMLTYPSLLIGFLMNSAMLGFEQSIRYVGAATIIFILFLVIYILVPSFLGGGDIKLLTVSAVLFGYKGFALITWYSFLFGGIVAMIWALGNGYLVEIVGGGYRGFRAWMKGEKAFESAAKSVEEGVEERVKKGWEKGEGADLRGAFPFAVAVMLGWVGAVGEVVGYLKLFQSSVGGG